MGWKNTVSVNLDDNTLYVPWDRKPYWESWLGGCLAVARSVFRLPANKYTAWEEWGVTQGKHLDRNFPGGVAILLWFEHWGTYYDERKKANWYGNWGHVAVYKDGTIYSSPLTKKAYFDKFWNNPVTEVEQKYKAKYVGWSEFIGSRRVAEFVPDAPPPPPVPKPAPPTPVPAPKPTPAPEPAPLPPVEPKPEPPKEPEPVPTPEPTPAPEVPQPVEAPKPRVIVPEPTYYRIWDLVKAIIKKLLGRSW